LWFEANPQQIVPQDPISGGKKKTLTKGLVEGLKVKALSSSPAVQEKKNFRMTLALLGPKGSHFKVFF
jgi:hypothetical protein